MTLKVENSGSLERQLKQVAGMLLLVFTALITWIMGLLHCSLLVMLTVYTLVLLPAVFWLFRFYQHIINPFYRLTSLVEAIRLEDYSLRAREQFDSGIIHSLYREIGNLSALLQQRKQVYDQHTLLIYHLIEQLDTPIAVFNQQLLLSHANKAFSEHLNQPWQSKRLYSGQRLGLMIDEYGQWQFIDDIEAQRWQIRQSHFIQAGQNYHLVILTNVEKVLRQKQQQSWQQIIRVLSHEIRNSLTPIKSLAQTLASIPTQHEDAQQALNVIIERTIALQEFVNRYSDISKRLNLKCQWFCAQQFIAVLQSLFAAQTITVNCEVERLWADPMLLEQVLINVIKNAIEASEPSNDAMQLRVTVKNQQQIIEVIDHGQGIANSDNLFVPFYTTKEKGQGIGLGLCQNIIEHHGGTLGLQNNKTGPGARAVINLPLPDTEPLLSG